MNWQLKVKYLHCGELLKASDILERLDELRSIFRYQRSVAKSTTELPKKRRRT